MTFEHRGELRADPGSAPGERNIVSRGSRRSIWPSIAVAAAAAAFGGVIWFAYQNGRQSTHSDEPPIVKADPTPVKVKPDQPGGQGIPFQNSTVYDRLQPNGQKPQVENLLPPPEAPVSLPRPSQAPSPASTGAPASLDQAEPLSLPDSSPTVLAPAPGLILSRPAPPQPRQPVEKALASPAKPQPTVAELIEKSPGPAAKAAPAAPIPATPPVQPSHGGVFRIQVSAVRSPEAVDPEWARLKKHFPETLAALKLSSSKIDVAGKGVFYRIQAGPLDQSAAKAACDHLKEKGLACLVVKP